ncbi:MAG: hypothetical protein COA67_01485 [Lutibacter sp.]|nr:MAG: hypothetical protein COA67_01485 [Lutibacter sp.]
MKKILKLAIFIIVLILLYFLFEPVANYNIGKKSIPNLENLTIEKKTGFSKADSILKLEYLKLNTPAISVAVGRNNKVIWSNQIGYSDIENKVKVNSLTKFRIGSTSKALTSAGIGILLQENKLNLNSLVKDFVPYASANLSNLTLAQIASHTSGIRNYKTCFCFPIWEYYNNDEYQSVKKSVGIFNGDKLLFQPGTDFSYSSYNFALLSAMIEGSSEINFIDFMSDNIFKPLDLQHTSTEKASKIKNIATFYDFEDNNYVASFKVNNSNKIAGGGFISTPIDLVKFGNALLNNQIINNTTTTTLFTPVKLKNGTINKQNYAIGWRNDISTKVFSDKRKTNIIHHGGVAVGSTSLLILVPEYNITVAILINNNSKSFNLFDTAYKFIELFTTENKQ